MFLGSLYHDRDSPLNDWLSTALEDDVHVVGLRKTGSTDDALQAPLYLLVTTHSNALVAYDPARDTGVIHDLPTEAPATRDTSLTRVSYQVAGKPRFEANRLASGDLDDLFAIAWEPRPRLLYLAAEAHLRAGRYADADSLLLACRDLLEDDSPPTAEGYMSPVHEVDLLRSVTATRTGNTQLAIDLLGELSRARPDDDLIAAGERVDAPEDWWMMLALAHEEAGDAASAARAYERLAGDHADADVFVLARARNLRDAGELDDAHAAFELYIQRRGAAELRLTEDPDEEWENSVAQVRVEVAEMLTEAGRTDDALAAWLAAVRAAPMRQQAYEGLFELVADASEPARKAHEVALAQAAEMVELLLPRLHESLEGRGLLPERAATRPWETELEPLDDSLHDDVLVHRGERASATLAQRWTAALLADERDVSGIVKHAQPADHPVVAATVANVSHYLGIEPPKVVLSHGSHGIEVLDRSRPFVLLGAAHLDATHDLALSDAGLAFAVASQLEHIRAGHLLLTSSEFWKTFGTKSMTALLAFVPMGDLVGKLTDSAVLKWLGKFKDAPSSGVNRMVQLVEERMNEGAGRETVQSAYAATLGKLRQVGLASAEAEADEEHLVKERLADFARSAQYTADRLGLVACGDLGDAVTAILRMSPSFAARTDDALDEGLAAVLSERDADGSFVHDELAARISELMAFALSADYRTLIDAMASSDE